MTIRTHHREQVTREEIRRQDAERAKRYRERKKTPADDVTPTVTPERDAVTEGLFVRSLIGLDREAAKAALSGFMKGKNPTANQIEFLNLTINHLSSRGWIELARLYTSPLTDIHPHGVDGLFDESTTLALISALQSVRRNATGMLVT
jgi:type I site-specific restriction endonuclease